jgi:hypothetical protein
LYKYTFYGIISSMTSEVLAHQVSRRGLLAGAAGLVVGSALAGCGEVSQRPSAVPLAGSHKPEASPSPTLLPSQRGELYLGVATADETGFTDFTAAVGKQAALHVVYKSWGSETNSAFPAKTAATDRQAGTLDIITWEPQNTKEGLWQPNFRLSEIYGGKYDGYIRSFAQAIQGHDGPVCVRLGHEANEGKQPWYPWSEKANGNRPGDFVKAYQYVFDLLASEGAANALSVWCINGVVPGGDPNEIRALFPGEKYVDVVAEDAYSDGSRSFAQADNGALAIARELAPKKPVLVTETGCPETADPNVKAARIIDTFKYAHDTGVDGVCYSYYQTGKRDYRAKTAAAQNALRQVGALPYVAGTKPGVAPDLGSSTVGWRKPAAA